ncbi:RsiW-degrading membrane proteinase PrsW (M82 family) [Stackebrandtia endophytica]|uniref:RsiW-degrading membrane proteinase PrsW (M82 family) n=1 Tax=Stackebrandtia endophytica TaxID=1496996 RepID=A0A543AY55_9ACTN|nr:PrsW family intramembrane metalloprotease [Stackebrandtia endophytica]TQL77515.1 RsiW-degrading membrane proteinase PrsW (M82 family) [Stackebrandtia endophytica]
MTAPVALASSPQHVFYQPRRPMFWVYVGLMSIGGFNLAMLLFKYLELAPIALAISMVINAVLAWLFLKLINWIDLFEREPLSLLVAGMGWGGIVATGFAIHANDQLITAVMKLDLDDWGAAIAAPIDEELLKLIGVIVVMVIGRAYIHRAMDGLILGMMCGVGFEVVENILYGVQSAIADVNSDVAAAVTTGLARLTFGVGGHLIFTGISGFGVGYVMTRRDKSILNRFGVAFGLFAVAWGLHFLWDAPFEGLITGPLLKYPILLIAIFLLYRYAIRREWDWFSRTMAGQPDEVITKNEITAMRTLRGRRKARRKARRDGGMLKKRQLRYLQDAQLGLAIALDRSDDPDKDPAVAARREDIMVAREALTQPLTRYRH